MFLLREASRALRRGVEAPQREQTAKRWYSHAVGVQTGTSNLVGAQDVCLKGRCCVAPAARHVRRWAERCVLAPSLIAAARPSIDHL